MEFRDFFEDDEMSVLKMEFRREKRGELSKWITEHKTATYSSDEMKRMILERRSQKQSDKLKSPPSLSRISGIPDNKDIGSGKPD